MPAANKSYYTAPKNYVPPTPPAPHPYPGMTWPLTYMFEPSRHYSSGYYATQGALYGCNLAQGKVALENKMLTQQATIISELTSIANDYSLVTDPTKIHMYHVQFLRRRLNRVHHSMTWELINLRRGHKQLLAYIRKNPGMV